MSLCDKHFGFKIMPRIVERGEKVVKPIIQKMALDFTLSQHPLDVLCCSSSLILIFNNNFFLNKILFDIFNHTFFFETIRKDLPSIMAAINDLINLSMTSMNMNRLVKSVFSLRLIKVSIAIQQYINNGIDQNSHITHFDKPERGFGIVKEYRLSEILYLFDIYLHGVSDFTVYLDKFHQVFVEGVRTNEILYYIRKFLHKIIYIYAKYYFTKKIKDEEISPDYIKCLLNNIFYGIDSKYLVSHIYSMLIEKVLNPFDKFDFMDMISYFIGVLELYTREAPVRYNSICGYSKGYGGCTYCCKKYPKRHLRDCLRRENSAPWKCFYCGVMNCNVVNFNNHIKELTYSTASHCYNCHVRKKVLQVV